MVEGDERERIGNAGTLPMPEETTDLPNGLPMPEVDGLGDEVERQRVFGALFGGTSRPFELGRYVVMSTLGRGGMGVVFKTFDPTLDRLVALKVLHEEIDEQHTTRLRREAKALAKLSHPNVVQVYEVGEVEGQTFVAMEMVKGKTLREWMKQHPRPGWREAVQVFIQVGEGLAAAHERGLVHRDFKPGNAIIDDKGRPRVLDFGLARQGQAREDEQSTIQPARTDGHEAAPMDVSLTKTGAVLGTPAYMPPEQMNGEQADARSDQFSFCVALYEAVYGERPFEGSSMMALMVSMRTGEVRPVPKGSDVPTTLRTVLVRGLATAAEERWPSMEELLTQLRAVIAPRRGRWLALGGGIALGLGLVGAGLAYQADMGQRCTGAEAQLDGVWDDARRGAVKASILGTELSYAPATWERVEPSLDGYADAWADKYTEICEATSVRGEQSAEALDLRMACLSRERTALRAAVDVLATAEADADAEAEVVKNAVMLVSGLPALTRCDDLNRLKQRDQRVPPPEDPEVASEVEALREELAAIEAKRNAGLYAEALADVEPLVQRAEELDYPPLHAEAEFWQGELMNRNGKYEDAGHILEQAHARATRNGHDAVALDAAQSLTFVMGGQLARHAEGRVWGRMAVALAEHTGEVTDIAVSLGSLGSVHNSQGEYEEAKHYFERGLQMEEKALEADHTQIASTLTNLGNVHSSQGEYEEAKRYFERAFQIQSKSLGANHPTVARLLNSLGSVQIRQGEHEEAKRYFERGLQIQEGALGVDHPDVAGSLNNLGSVHASQGNYEEAKRYFERGLRTQEKALGADHPAVASSLTNLGAVHQILGDYEGSKRYNERALEIFEEVLGADHPTVAAGRNNLGSLYEYQGEYEAAKRNYLQALQISEKTQGPDHPDVAAILNNLGLVHSSQGEYEDAKRYHERALHILGKALGADHPDVAYSLVGLATVALRTGDSASAREHAGHAIAILEAASVTPELLANSRFVLAQALWGEPTQRPRARELAEHARELFAEHGKGRKDDLAEVEAWLAKHPVK